MKKLFLLFILTSNFCFSQDSLQVAKPKLSVIELEKIKVVYRGIDNPISIAVPKNVKSFKVAGKGVSSTNEVGKYIVRPNLEKEMTIKVEMVLFDNSVVVEEHIYEIKRIPNLYYSFNDYRCNTICELKRKEIKDAMIGTGCDGFLFYGFSSTVKSFNLKVPGYKTQTIIGNKITDEVYKIILKAKKNDEIVISEIRRDTTILPMMLGKTNPLVIRVMD